MFSQFSTEKQANLEKSTKEIQKSLDARINAMLTHLQTQVTYIVNEAVKNIRPAEDGHTPTTDELMALFTPVIEQHLKKLVELTDTKEKPFDLAEFESQIIEKLKNYTTKRGGGGGGVRNFSELNDVTKKAEKYGVPFKGFENKYPRVSPDGTKIIFDNPTGGGGFTELEATGAVDGSNVSFTFTQVPSYIVADGIWYKPTAKNGTTFWTNVSTSVTMVNPPAYDIFGVA